MILKNKELCQQDIDLKKQQMRNQLTSLVPSAIFLDDEIFSLFVLLPWDSDSSFDSLTSLLEQLCPGLEEWFCGASSRKFGLEKDPRGLGGSTQSTSLSPCSTRDLSSSTRILSSFFQPVLSLFRIFSLKFSAGLRIRRRV